MYCVKMYGLALSLFANQASQEELYIVEKHLFYLVMETWIYEKRKMLGMLNAYAQPYDPLQAVEQWAENTKEETIENDRNNLKNTTKLKVAQNTTQQVFDDILKQSKHNETRNDKVNEEGINDKGTSKTNEKQEKTNEGFNELWIKEGRIFQKAPRINKPYKLCNRNRYEILMDRNCIANDKFVLTIENAILRDENALMKEKIQQNHNIMKLEMIK